MPSPVRPEADALDAALDVLAGRPLVALTGAGLSTDSGIPDYRGPSSPRRTPMTYTEFVSGPRRAAPVLGAQPRRLGAAWPAPSPTPATAPSPRSRPPGVLHGVITQNVDGLHRAAGSRAVIDLHGRIADVVCLGCRRISPRDELQQRLAALNPGFIEAVGLAGGDRTGRRRRARRGRGLPARRVHAAAGAC